MNDINKLQENIYREQTQRVKRWNELVAKVKELKKIKKPTYKDKVQGGKSYAYNVTAVDNGGQKGTRSLTEYGKALLQSPANIKAIANKNAISLEWSAVENASSYNVFRDDDLINTTTELEYSDYKLKFDEEY